MAPSATISRRHQHDLVLPSNPGPDRASLPIGGVVETTTYARPLNIGQPSTHPKRIPAHV